MAKKTQLAVATLLALLIAAAAWWMSADADASRPSPGTQPVAEPEIAQGEHAAGAEPIVERAKVQDLTPATIPATGSTTRQADAGTVELLGRIVVRDLAGVEHADLSGKFLLGGEHGRGSVRSNVVVTHGQFAAQVPPDTRFNVWNLELGGRSAKVVDKAKYFDVPASRSLEIRARFGNDVLLHVIDAESRIEPAGVEVRRRWSWRGDSDDIHPGDHANVETLCTNATSPISVPEPHLHFSIYWARAAGYGWSRIRVDHTQGGERTVELRAGAAVEVAIDGSVPKLYVRLYRGEPPLDPAPAKPDLGAVTMLTGGPPRHLVEVRAAGTGPIRIDDLAPGDYHVAVETGEFQAKRELGSAPAVLQAGAVARVRVTLSAQDTEPGVPLRGTVTAADAETLDVPFALLLERIEGGQETVRVEKAAMKPVAGNPLRLAFAAGAVLSGHYLAYVTSLQHRVVFQVPPGGLTDLDIALPPLARAFVRVVDESTGAVIVPKKAQWCDAALPDVHTNRLSDARLDRSTGEVQLRTVAGEIELSLEHPDYMPTEKTLVLRAGDNHEVVQMKPALGITVRLQSSGSALPAPADFWDGIRIEGDQVGDSWSSRSDATSYTQYVAGPGTFTVRLPVLEGYRPPAPREVGVKKGIVEVVFDLAKSGRER